MKLFLSNRTNKISFITLLTIGTISIFSSCKKDTGYDFEGAVTANVRLVNTSPDAGAAKLYVADVLRTPNAVAYGEASTYQPTYVGQQDISAQTNGGAVIATTNSQIDAANSYTYFLSGSNGSQSLIFVKDDTEAATSGKAKVKFVQAATASTAVDVLANGVSLFAAQAYKAVSTYNEVAAGAYVFKVTNVGSSTALATSASINLESGKKYIIYTKGTVGGSGSSALGIAMLTVN